MGTELRLEARRLSKTYGGSRALQDADLAVAPGEIHALVGQNGCGKSTLVKILTGYHAPDPGGSVLVDGTGLSLPVRWSEASAAGVSVVHQDLGLLDQLTVAENIGVGGYRHAKTTRKIDWRAQNEVARRVLDRLRVPVDPTAPVASLSPTRRAEVAIARALRDLEPGRGLIVLDEATRALPREELDRFHGLLKRIVAEGTSILMVSHNLEEVLRFADRVTVLRDGRVAAAALPTKGLTEHDLARHMLGRTVDAVAREERDFTDAPAVATVTGLTARGLTDFALEIRRGEVVGLTGLPGSGFEWVPRLVAGIERAKAGLLTTGRRTVDLSRADVRDCLKAGVALVPEKRVVEGLALELSIRDNIAIPDVNRRGRPWFVGRRWQSSTAAEAITRLGIRARSARSLIRELSGGNQQKVLLAKWLAVAPEAVVLHEPTQAVDVGARADILRSIREAASRGLGVLLVSIEPTDLVDACDRILVVGLDGRVRTLRTHEPDDVFEAVYEEPAPTGPAPAGPTTDTRDDRSAGTEGR
ncbi:sugar ABC transporter ATP-binding protein [Streptomyces shenzhenensis]|uniref:sugar ABC transporter ATP-binding protein n=1 Tax=Streptomyces shenzhenensis TaxID=943815 RepID=UPI001F244B79|nr:sugar ABC transporter ATP-binding protein [Streptomyces shenzhenensis]